MMYKFNLPEALHNAKILCKQNVPVFIGDDRDDIIGTATVEDLYVLIQVTDKKVIDAIESYLKPANTVLTIQK